MQPEWPIFLPELFRTMDSVSYSTIEQIIKNHAGDFDTMVSVPIGALRNLFKAINHYMSEKGQHGYTLGGAIVVDQFGMDPVVISIFEEEFGDGFDEYIVELVDTDFKVTGIRKVGTYVHKTSQTYTLDKIKSKRKVECIY